MRRSRCKLRRLRRIWSAGHARRYRNTSLRRRPNGVKLQSRPNSQEYDQRDAQKAQPGETLFTDLWWSATAQPKLDYSVGVYLLDANGQVVAQSDNAPGDVPTSQWMLDKLYFDRHTLIVPAGLPAGTYQVAVGVYWFGDQRLLPVAGKLNLIVGQIQVGVP